jgi:hypothetical protein
MDSICDLSERAATRRVTRSWVGLRYQCRGDDTQDLNLFRVNWPKQVITLIDPGVA